MMWEYKHEYVCQACESTISFEWDDVPAQCPHCNVTLPDLAEEDFDRRNS